MVPPCESSRNSAVSSVVFPFARRVDNRANDDELRFILLPLAVHFSFVTMLAKPQLLTDADAAPMLRIVGLHLVKRTGTDYAATSTENVRARTSE
jgi:hypothetical protein